MSAADAAEQSLKGGDPVAALAQLQEQVRARPADPKLRIFLFQLLCVLGQWERALNQLKVASGLDPGALAMAQTYGDAVRCEAIRREVFDGKKSPMIFGQPEQWLALLIESLLLSGRGEPAKSEELRLRAFDEAPARQPATSTGSRLPGSATLIRGWVRCSRRSSTGGTTGSLLAAEQDHDRSTRGFARRGLDADASAVRERRRVGGADTDAIPGLGNCG